MCKVKIILVNLQESTSFFSFSAQFSFQSRQFSAKSPYSSPFPPPFRHRLPPPSPRLSPSSLHPSLASRSSSLATAFSIILASIFGIAFLLPRHGFCGQRFCRFPPPSPRLLWAAVLPRPPSLATAFVGSGFAASPSLATAFVGSGFAAASPRLSSRPYISPFICPISFEMSLQSMVFSAIIRTFERRILGIG